MAIYNYINGGETNTSVIQFNTSSVSKHYSGYLPTFRVNKKGSVKVLIDSISLITIAALTGIVVVTGGAAISKAVSGIASALKGIATIMYKKHYNNKTANKISKMIGSRKIDGNDTDTQSPSLPDISSVMNVK
jgi:hypothetical protein